MEIKEYINNNLKNGEIVGVIGNIEKIELDMLPHDNVDSIKVLEHLSTFSSKDMIIKALKIVELEESILNKQINSLSIAEANKIGVAEAFLKKEELYVFLDIHKGLKYREIQNLKRLLKALAENNKKIVIVSNDIEFYFNFVKKVVLVDNNDEIKEKNPINWFDEEIYHYVAKPPIIDFVMNCKKRNIKIDNCVETKELLKSIYRSVDK